MPRSITSARSRLAPAIRAARPSRRCLAVLTLAVLLAGPARAEIRVNAPELGPERSAEAVAIYETGIEHLEARDWASAQRVLGGLVEREPDYGAAWYQLSYCRLLSGDHAGAAVGWERSAELGFLPAESRYNLACAYALLGETERALAALEGAIERGYSDVDGLQQDADLASLRELPRFRALIQPVEYPGSAGGTSVTFRSSEGHDVFGVLYEAPVDAPKEAPCFLLFHQAGSNVAEYFPIAPRLADEGYNCLTIDAHGGGDAYGRVNETIAAHGERGGGAEAMDDFRAALAFLDAEGYTGDRVVWGSSYSAGRVFALLAEKHDRIVAGVAFSPGRGYAREGEDGEASWASQVEVPVFLAAPSWEYDAGWRSRFDSIASEDKWLYVPVTGGAHGSAMLRPDRNPTGHEAAWNEVVAFIDTYVSGGVSGESTSMNR